VCWSWTCKCENTWWHEPITIQQFTFLVTCGTWHHVMPHTQCYSSHKTNSMWQYIYINVTIWFKNISDRYGRTQVRYMAQWESSECICNLFGKLRKKYKYKPSIWSDHVYTWGFERKFSWEHKFPMIQSSFVRSALWSCDNIMPETANTDF
jgi:hypothetical protein